VTDKPFEKWTWEDLMTFACWEVITGITKGQTLRESMHRVLTMTVQWKPPKGKK
jgi:hypothetical protein